MKMLAGHDRFQRIIEDTDAGYFRVGIDGCYQDVNSGWLRLYGFQRKEDAIGMRFSTGCGPEDVASAEQLFESLMRGEKAKLADFCRVRQDGTTGHHTLSASPIIEGNCVIAIEGFIVDISDRRKAERQRRQSDEQYRSLFDFMHEGVAVHKLTYSGDVPNDYLILDVNRRYEEIFSLKREDVTNRLGSDVFRLSVPPYLKPYASAVQTRSPVDFEAYCHQTGKYFMISVAPMGEDLFSAVFFDVSERKNAEESMRSLVTAIEQVGEAIFTTDLDGIIQYCNPTFEKVTGYAKNEAIGQNIGILRSGKHSPEFYAQMWKTIRRGKVWAGHLTSKRKDGSFCEEEVTISPIRNGSGELSGFVTVKRDVTEKMHLERELFQGQKLESIGRLAAGIAHDFNNLLTAINGYSDLIIGQVKVGDPVRSYAAEIRKAGERSVCLTKQLLAFSRKQTVEPRVLNLNTTISDSAAILERLIGEEISVETRLEGSLGQIIADPTQIDQVLMNLAVNARDAMPHGGKLTIETSNVDVSEVTAALYPDAMPGPYVLMTVTDNGQGMDETIRLQVFEPFFTTKELGRGTGLGLSTVYGIVRQSGGWIDLWSELRVGTSFKVYFPRVDRCPVVLPERPDSAAEGGRETILIVEDQKAVRSFAKIALEKYGYHVIEASSGKMALAVAKRYIGEIHLLLTDVVLAGMNGKVLSDKLKALRPSLKVLFTSGYTADAIAHRGVLHEGVSYIPKPFGPNEIAAKIRALLGDHSKSAGLNVNAEDGASDSVAGSPL